MNSKEFDEEVLESTLNVVRETMKSKRKEYSDDVNPFRNFDNASRVDRISPDQALWGMLLKHLVSIMDIKNSKFDKHDKAYIDEKINDAITYFILLKGVFYRDKTK